MFLHYPFYHQHRPRFFNTATVSNLVFEALRVGLIDYLRDVSINFGMGEILIRVLNENFLGMERHDF